MPDKSEVTSAQNDLSKGLPITRSDEVTHFLGVDIHTIDGSYCLRQLKGIKALLNEMSMENTRSIGSPLESNIY